MGIKATEEIISTVRSVVGPDFSEMDIIRALHMANNDPTAAINIIFDAPRSFKKPEFPKKTESSNCNHVADPPIAASSLKQNVNRVENSDYGLRSNASLNCSVGVNDSENNNDSDSGCGKEMGSEWWFLGSCEMAGMSTCKGRTLKPGDVLSFKFPVEKRLPTPSPGKLGGGRGRQVASCSEILRFSTQAGEIGRIPNEWARCLLPLVRDKKVCLKGCCKFAPPALGIMDTIVLDISVYINSSKFQKSHLTSIKPTSDSAEESVVQPFPNLLKLLGLVPFKKAEFTPGDLYTRKRPSNAVDLSGLSPSLLCINKFKITSSEDRNKVENDESISDNDLDNIVGVTDSSELEEMEPPSTLLCELRPYQKQALNWMIHLERGHCVDEAAETLHPCWDAYRLADKRGLVIYVNAFSGDAATEFPSTLQMARGGILADSMGLGKTIMTISLLLSHSERGRSLSSSSTSQHFKDNCEASFSSDNSPIPPKKASKFASFEKLMKPKSSLTGGGNLIVCPMTLIGQWKTEIETHTQPGALSHYVHYGQTRLKDAKVLAQNDVVLTTYGVLASEFSTENAEDNGGLFSVRWFRVVLDEAHTIKSSKSQISTAAAALAADRRWCLTGTPIQNNLEDAYSLLRFLKIEPWGSWVWWNKLVQKPFDEGDERGLKLVQSILKPIMLRRTKSSTDREGRPILVLPPADIQVIYCNLSETEKDFYEALFKKSKVKFDQFVEQGRVLHNYASILELLLRLRQCCDHPFLVMRLGYVCFRL